MTDKRPADYADGWGELIRAHRCFIGISQRTLAAKMNLSERSLSDIEIGRRSCPPGFLDAMEAIADEFDQDVENVIASANGVTLAAGEQRVPITVKPGPDQEWQRAVVGRAAVQSSKIMPTLARE